MTMVDKFYNNKFRIFKALLLVVDSVSEATQRGNHSKDCSIFFLFYQSR